MYSIITKHRIGKAPTSDSLPNTPSELAQGFIMKLEANTDPDQANELNRLLDRGDYLVRALDYHFTFGIAELLGRYLMHGYIPTMSPNPKRDYAGRYDNQNKLIEELASHYNALAMHAGLEARAYQGSKHQELTGEDWEDRSELIRFETA